MPESINSTVSGTWHLLLDRPRPGYQNMARDQALLDVAQEQDVAILRLYAWEPFCISFGRNEPALRRYDRDLIEKNGVECVRRPTGGRAVWHARELTYAVAAPVGLFGSLSSAYREIHRFLAEAVTALGAEALLAPSPGPAPSLDAGACFASPVGGEVMVQGAKLIGSAQLQQGSVFLQHGSLLLEDSQQQIHQLTRGHPPDSMDRPLASILGRSIGFVEAATVITNVARTWAGDWTPWQNEEYLTGLAARHEPRFQSREWTWRR